MLLSGQIKCSLYFTVLVFSIVSCKKEYPQIDDTQLGPNVNSTSLIWKDIPTIQIEAFTVHAVYPENLVDIYPDPYFKIIFDTLYTYTSISEPIVNVGIGSNIPPVTYQPASPWIIETSQIDSSHYPKMEFIVYDEAFGSNPLLCYDKYYRKTFRICQNEGLNELYVKDNDIVVSMKFSFIE